MSAVSIHTLRRHASEVPWAMAIPARAALRPPALAPVMMST